MAFKTALFNMFIRKAILPYYHRIFTCTAKQNERFTGSSLKLHCEIVKRAI